MRAVLLLVVVFVALVAAKPKWHQLEGYTFDRYLKDFGKPYEKGTEEYSKRKTIFDAALQEAKAHNAKGLSWRKGINHLSDLTAQELKGMRGHKSREMRHITDALNAQNKKHVLSGKALPAAVDYRNATPAVLTAVKDQGMCGSCWAHATVEGVETFYALKTGNLFVLSQQQLTSCTPNPNQCGGTGGCAGATPQVAMDYIKTVGLTQEWQYPYTSYFGDSGSCKSTISPVVQISGYVNVDSNDYNAVMDALAHQGPLAIAVAADQWPAYESGIFSGCTFNTSITIDHAVQLVGYGTDADSGADYWIVRNSWSPGWGEDGFIRLARSSTVQCGWDQDPSQGSACKNGPTKQYVCGQCGILFDTCYPTI